MARNEAFMVGEWRVEPMLDQISRGDEIRSLRRQVMQLLTYLADRPREVISTDELLTELWHGRVVSDGSVYNCVSELRVALTVDGQAAPLIETIPKRGYRLLAPVTPLAPEQAKRISPVGVSSAVAALLAFAAFGALFAWMHIPGDADSSFQSIAVLPLENHTPDSDSTYITDGMTEMLIASISQIPEIRVISRTSAMQLKGSERTIPEIADLLGVDAIIEGSVMVSNDQVRVNLQLIDGETDAHLWSNTYMGDLDDIFRWQNDVSASTVADLQALLPGSTELSALPSPFGMADIDAEAYGAYLRGRYRFSQFGEDNFRAALSHYDEAIARDPSFALAYASRAEVCLQAPVLNGGLRTLSECEPDALRAVQLDDGLPDSHAILGLVHFLNWRLKQAEAEFEHAINLNPNSAVARQWYAELLRSTYRFDAALIEIETAERLDPLNLFVKTMVSWPLYNQRQYDLVLAQLNDVIEMNPGFMLAHYNRGIAFVELRQPDDVFAAADKVEELLGPNALETRLLRASGHAISGEHAQALEILEGVESEAGKVLAAWIASIYLMLGEEDQALARLEKGVEDRSPDLLTITEPKFDSIRKHPRFLAVSRAIGIPEPE